MKRIILALVFVSITTAFCCAESAKHSRFKIDETAIDAQFEQSLDITSEVDELFIANDLSKTRKPAFDTKQETAAIVATIMVLTGIGVLVPIHRFILGTDGKNTKIFFAYFCTASGCGVGLTLDAIFLLMHMDEINYEDCPKIIMWND